MKISIRPPRKKYFKLWNPPLTALDIHVKITYNGKNGVLLERRMVLLFKAALMVEGTMPIGNVVLLGLGTVFVGLISIVILCWLMGKIVSPAEKKKASPEPAAPAPAAAGIPNRPELAAVISCVVAEELGADVSAIRILSLKKL